VVRSNRKSPAAIEDDPVQLQESATGAPFSGSAQAARSPSEHAKPATRLQNRVRASTGPVTVELDDAAIAFARYAAAAEARQPADVGEFLLAIAEDDVAVTATFAANQVGYLGWQWSVTLAVLDRVHPTVSEVVLLPHDGALLAPVWIPWDERIRPGDLGVGDLLPPLADDPRLAAAYIASDDPAVEAVANEIGIGRVRVLSREGRIDFAERLHDGSFGPTDEMAVAAPSSCVSCAFYLPLAGSLGQLLGACGNEFSPADGRVVDASYGCGAHSETVVDMPARSATAEMVTDEVTLEVHIRPVSQPGIVGPADEWADPYQVGAELAGIELAEAASLDGAPDDVAAVLGTADGVAAALEG